MYVIIFQIIIDFMRVIIIYQTKSGSILEIIEYIKRNIYQINSNIMNNSMLLLSFGLSSPTLCICICLSTMINIYCWLFLIGYCIFSYLEMKKDNQCNIISIIHQEEQNSYIIQSPVLDVQMNMLNNEIIANKNNNDCSDNNNLKKLEETYQLTYSSLIQLNQNVKNVIKYISVCKWPVMFTSCFFITLLCWDMVGDQEGWYQGIWVPISGVIMFFFFLLLNYITTKTNYLKSSNFLFSKMIKS